MLILKKRIKNTLEKKTLIYTFEFLLISQVWDGTGICIHLYKDDALGMLA